MPTMSKTQALVPSWRGRGDCRRADLHLESVTFGRNRAENRAGPIARERCDLILRDDEICSEAEIRLGIHRIDGDLLLLVLVERPHLHERRNDLHARTDRSCGKRLIGSGTPSDTALPT